MNSHGLPHRNLNPARLPIPPLSHILSTSISRLVLAIPDPVIPGPAIPRSTPTNLSGLKLGVVTTPKKGRRLCHSDYAAATKYRFFHRWGNTRRAERKHQADLIPLKSENSLGGLLKCFAKPSNTRSGNQHYCRGFTQIFYHHLISTCGN